jgi:hypothetical protein
MNCRTRGDGDWAVALTPYGPSCHSLRATLSSGVVPVEFLVWRED